MDQKWCGDEFRIALRPPLHTDTHAHSVTPTQAEESVFISKSIHGYQIRHPHSSCGDRAALEIAARYISTGTHYNRQQWSTAHSHSQGTVRSEKSHLPAS